MNNNMRTLVAWLSLLAVIMVSCNGGNGYETYENEEYGFKIDYPSDWDTTNFDERTVFMAREVTNDSTESLPVGFNVSIVDNQGMSLQSIVDENVKMTKYYFDSPEITEEKFTTDNGISCIKVEVIYEAIGLNLSNAAIFINHNSSLFTITMSTEVKDKSKYDTVFEDVINSLEWLTD